MTIRINKTQVQQVLEILDDGYSGDASFRPTYSGRGMYGRTCAGFVHTGSSFKLGVALGQVLEEDAYELSASTDNMGYSTITYFTNLEFDSAYGEWEDED